MARSFLVGIDLNKNQLSNAVIQNLAGAPGSPVEGQIYYDTTSHILYFYNGAGWVNAGGISTGVLSGRPAAASSNAGTFFYATDNFLIYYSDGATWQQVSNFGSVTAQTSYGASSGNGSSTNFARADHTHGTPSLGTSTPSTASITQTGAAGTATVPSKEDHSHAGPGFGSSTVVVSSTSSTNGTATSVSHSDHTHGLTQSGFPISSFGTPTADWSNGGYKITSLGTPSADTDAANKGYVDSVAQGLDVKASVHLATATGLPAYSFSPSSGGTITGSSNGALSVDGTVVQLADRILVKNETSGNAPYNGIYTVTIVGSGGQAYQLTRSADANTSAEVTAGMFTFVEEGTVNADSSWVLTTNNPIVLNTTALTFAQFSGAGTYTASNGVLLTGSNFTFAPLSTGGLDTASGGASIKLQTNSGAATTSSGFAVGAGTGITVGTSTVSIDTSVVVRKYGADIGTGSATSITVTHNLGTKDVSVTVFDNSSPYAEVVCDVQHTTTNTVTLLFSVAPTSNQYRVAVLG